MTSNKKQHVNRNERSAGKTELYDFHVDAGARMTRFAGWEMPLWYTSAGEEHRAVREGAGIFDIAHMGYIIVDGPHAHTFLNDVTTNKIDELPAGRSRYGFILDHDGGCLDDLIIYRLEENRFLLVVNSANEQKDCRWLTSRQGKNMGEMNRGKKSMSREAVHILNLREARQPEEQLRGVAVQGPGSFNIVSHLLDGADSAPQLDTMKKGEIRLFTWNKAPLYVSRTGYTGEKKGVELFFPSNQAKDIWKIISEKGKSFGLLPCGLAARDSLRIEAGLPLYGHELSGSLGLTPCEAGFSRFVRFDKSFFIGRERLLELEKNRKRIVIRWKMRKKGVRMVHYGDPVTDEKGEMTGHVTSCSRGPDGYLIGLAVIQERSDGEPKSVNILARKHKDDADSVRDIYRMDRREKEELLEQSALSGEADILPRFL